MHQKNERENILSVVGGHHIAAVDLFVGGKSLGELSSGALKPPLVSFVVICWNYAQFVSQTIASIKDQDYPNFECIVINNGSTDDSGAVIENAVAEDKRFTIAHLPENLGQLGAAFWALDRIKGNFVVFVDADDILFPAFASTHLQVHLAVPRSVAMSTSNIVEINAAGELLTRRYDLFGKDGGADTKGLAPENKVVRLSTISDVQYRLLGSQTSTRSPYKGGWFWAPGTSNMFRRTVLDMCRIKGHSNIFMRSSDSHFNHLCHAIGGTAIIDHHLAGYRQHGSNYFSKTETIAGVRQGSPNFAAISRDTTRETLECLLERTAFFNWILAGRYWAVIDQLPNVHPELLPGYFGENATKDLFTRHIQKICDEFGYKISVRQICARFDRTSAKKIFRDGLAPENHPLAERQFRLNSIKKVLSFFKRKKQTS